MAAISSGESCLLFNLLQNLNCYLLVHDMGSGIFETSHPLCRDRSIALAYRSGTTTDPDSSKNSRCPCITLSGKINIETIHTISEGVRQAKASGNASKDPVDLRGGSIEAAGDALQRSLQLSQALQLRKAMEKASPAGS